MVHSEARTVLDNLIKIQSWNAWLSSRNVHVAFFVVPRKGDGDGKKWNRVWVQYGLLLRHMFGNVCYFFFHSDLPSTHCTTFWKWSFYKHHVCPSIRPSIWSEFPICMKKPWVLRYPLSAQQRQIRLGGCPGWSESSLGAHRFVGFCHALAHL